MQLEKVISPLTDPTAHGGVAEDTFDLVLPSMPGYSFSEKPKAPSWGPDRIARAWDALMQRLGYTRYVSQGGDWGAVIADVMARQAPPGLLGIHVNRLDRTLIYYHRVDKGGHCAAWEEPQLFAEEIRAAFRSLRSSWPAVLMQDGL